MNRATWTRILIAVGVATLGAVGCGLISSDVTSVSYPIPQKTYTFDSAMWGVPMGNSVAVPCGGASPIQDCCNPPAPVPKPTCNATTKFACEASVCTFKQVVTLVSPVNFKTDVPALANAVSLANVSLESLDYNVTTNTLNVPVPPMELFLAPDGVMDPSSAQAVKFGTVPMIPAGQTKMDSVTLEPDADATFTQFASNLSAPFNIIMSTTVSVPTGSPTPMGRLTVVVSGQFKAKLAL